MNIIMRLSNLPFLPLIGKKKLSKMTAMMMASSWTMSKGAESILKKSESKETMHRVLDQ